MTSDLGEAMYAGFDLGTSNSAAAVFHESGISVVSTAHGGYLTPSVVRFDSRGRSTVGDRARKFLDTDPDNTHSEFKRLMGTGKTIRFTASNTEKKPEELAALVLQSLRRDVEDQFGIAPDNAVISVPALFELPQSAATSEAARQAGFERVELLQEPIASALAAGWSADDSPGSWLVYDLGGGTFDVSLLETRDGLLRVVGHDGDNFLGGRDFDWAIVDWLIAQLKADGITLDRANPEDAAILRALRRAAEEAKIDLSRTRTCAIDLTTTERDIHIDVEFDRDTLDGLCRPGIDKTIDICTRLLQTHGLTTSQLERIVLVGGPTVMPCLRQHLMEQLDVPISEGHDPMTIVAKGAAIYAATAGLDARPAKAKPTEPQRSSQELWLQYPAVSSDLTPHVVGKLTGTDTAHPPTTIQLVRTDGQWSSGACTIGPDGGFILSASLEPRRSNTFTIEARDASGNSVRVSPARISIMQGLTITDPPLSRSVGVALANNSVCVYFERGAALPARRTFTHHTVESVAKGAQRSVVKIPLVQGEFEWAHLCRLVGTLEVSGSDIADSVPSGSPVEVTIELDRGGRLSARARIPAIEQVFEHVAHLLVPEATIEVLNETLGALRERVASLREASFRSGYTRILDRLSGVEEAVASIERDVDAARGGDADTAQKARRGLIELDAQIAAIELDRKWPELEQKALQVIAWASDWISQYATDVERKLYFETAEAISRAREEKNVAELQRQLRLARRLGNAAFYRHPDVWEWMFEDAASEADRATDLPAANRLLDQGRSAVAEGNSAELRRIVQKLWRLLPPDIKDRRLSFDSGVR